MNVLEQIRDAFPDHGVPSRELLVVFDGFDQPAKEYALDLFGGKTRDQVRALVGKGATGFEGLWGVEDLQVLEPAALQYYLEPFLTFLIKFEYSKPDEVSFFLCYHLSEVIRIRGADTFTNFPASFLFLGQERWLGLPTQAWIFFAVAIGVWVLATRWPDDALSDAL